MKDQDSSAALLRTVRAWLIHPSTPNSGIPIQHHPTKHEYSPGCTVANTRLSGVQHLSKLSRDMDGKVDSAAKRIKVLLPHNFEPSLDALSLRSDVISPIQVLSLA